MIFGPISLPLNTEGWLDTGLAIPANVGAAVVATGVGYFEGDRWYPCYPSGCPAYPIYPIPGTPLATGRTPFSLVLALSATKPSFGYGSALQGGASLTIPPGAGGRLWIGFNDLNGAAYDNTGSFLVTIEFDAKAPEEAQETMTRYLDDTVTIWKQFTDVAGAAADAAGAPAYRVYEETTDTPILTGTLAKQDDPNTTGFYRGQFVASAASGFEVGKSYCVRVSATVANVDQAAIVERFAICPNVDAQVWGAAIPPEAAGNPTTMGGLGRRLLSKAKNRLVKSGNLVTTYADDNATALVTQQYSVTDTGFDRSGDA
jgi:hypothetical protein